MPKPLTDISVRNMKPGPVRREIPDGGCKHLYLVVQPSGAKSYAVRYRFNGRPKKLTLASGLSLAAARRAATDAAFEVSQGRDPGETKKAAKQQAANTLRAVADQYLAIEGPRLRTVGQQRNIFDRLICPTLGALPIGALKRSNIVRLLDKVEIENGPRMADYTLAVLSRSLNWFASRSDTFANPVVRGMRRHKNEPRARTLSDDEIRALWAATEEPRPFNALVRFLLLTAARRSEAAQMRWSEIDGTDWCLPPERNKVKQPLCRPLSQAAQDILASLPRISGCEFCFSNDGRRPVGSFTALKRAFDERSGVTNWVLHDLRRTARSLMSRAGTSSDIAERCLGHTLGGVRGVYDRHAYREEMRRAFERLAQLIERIVEPQDNVVPLRG